MPRPTPLPVSVAELRRLHRVEHITALRLAERFGVSRPVVARWFRENGIAAMSPAEVQAIRMSRTTPEERQRLTAAAHAAVRGRRAPNAERVKMALGRERNRSGVGPGELAAHATLARHGVATVHQKAIGRYNVDLAHLDAKVAIELFGGRWHAHGRHKAREPKRLRFLRQEGWTVVYVWLVKDRAYRLRDGGAVLIAEIVARRLSGAIDAGEHFHIDGNGGNIPRQSAYGAKVRPLTIAERRDPATGRLLAITQKSLQGYKRNVDEPAACRGRRSRC